jgi:hypothetical protein
MTGIGVKKKVMKFVVLREQTKSDEKINTRVSKSGQVDALISGLGKRSVVLVEHAAWVPR